MILIAMAMIFVSLPASMFCSTRGIYWLLVRYACSHE